MRLVPTGNTELNLNNRWVFEKYLELIEQFACDPDGFGSSGPGLEESVKLIRLAVVRKDRKAEDEAILARMRVEVRELWQDFRELTLLGELLRRAALREAGCSSPGGTDPPSCREALRLARALVAGVPGRSLKADAQGEDRFGLEWESAAVSSVLADQWLREGTRKTLQEYVKLSGSNPNYFNALGLIWDELKLRGNTIPSKLSRWKKEVDAGTLRQPSMRPIPGHRPATTTKPLSDLDIQFIIEIMSKTGIKPAADGVSGIRILEKVLKASEDPALRLTYYSLRRIWQQRLWGKSPKAVQRYQQAISNRQGPFHTAKR